VPVEGLRKIAQFGGAGAPVSKGCPQREQGCLELAQTERLHDHDRRNPRSLSEKRSD